MSSSTGGETIYFIHPSKFFHFVFVKEKKLTVGASQMQFWKYILHGNNQLYMLKKKRELKVLQKKKSWKWGLNKLRVRDGLYNECPTILCLGRLTSHVQRLQVPPLVRIWAMVLSRSLLFATCLDHSGLSSFHPSILHRKLNWRLYLVTVKVIHLERVYREQERFWFARTPEVERVKQKRFPWRYIYTSHFGASVTSAVPRLLERLFCQNLFSVS